MSVVARGLTAAFVLAAFVAGCGGSEPSSSASGATEASLQAPATLTPKTVMRCIVEGGGEPWPLVPSEPKGSPKNPRTAFAIGPDRGHIAVYLDLSPPVARRMARGFDEFGEYAATVVDGGTALVLLDTQISKADRTVAFTCAGA